MSDEIEYIEPTQDHVGQMVEVEDLTGWKQRKLLAVLPQSQVYKFICQHGEFANHLGKWFKARVPRPKPQPVQETTTKPIDWTKPVRTKDGRAVRVLCTDGPGDYSVIGLVDGECRAWSWTLGGIQNTGTTGPCDLENVPQRIQREYWVNVYEDSGYDAIHDSTKHAAEYRNTKRKCLACIKITIDCEQGEGL